MKTESDIKKAHESIKELINDLDKHVIIPKELEIANEVLNWVLNDGFSFDLQIKTKLEL